MPKYKVFVTEESHKYFIVEAKDKDDAERIAVEMYENGDSPIDTHEGGYEWGGAEEVVS